MNKKNIIVTVACLSLVPVIYYFSTSNDISTDPISEIEITEEKQSGSGDSQENLNNVDESSGNNGPSLGNQTTEIQNQNSQVGPDDSREDNLDADGANSASRTNIGNQIRPGGGIFKEGSHKHRRIQQIKSKIAEEFALEPKKHPMVAQRLKRRINTLSMLYKRRLNRVKTRLRQDENHPEFLEEKQFLQAEIRTLRKQSKELR